MATSTSRGAGKSADAAGGLKRIAFLAALALMAALMLRDSLAFVMRPVDPALAYQINPGNADAAEARATQLLLENVGNRVEAARIARQALKRSPVSAAGARALGATMMLIGDTAAAQRLVEYSESLSRRDLPTQLWLIQNAVEHNDIPAALRHYDIALRASYEAGPILFPVLLQALSQPQVVDGLIVTIAARPLWAPDFLSRASQSAQDMDGLARLISGLARRGYPIEALTAARATARMVDSRHYGQAWRVYIALHPAALRDAVRDPSFVHADTEASPFDWTITAGNGLMAEPRLYGGVAVLAYSAETGSSGVVARQILLLPAGHFDISGRAFRGEAAAPPAQLRLTCANDGAAIIAVTANRPSFAQAFTIPADCPAQRLEVVADGGDMPIGGTGEIGDIRIVREQRQ